MQDIGIVREVWRYPVKSMAGEQVHEAFVSYSGLKGDRVYAFVNPEDKSNRPWITQREIPELALYKPRFRHKLDNEIHFPSDDSFGLDVMTPDDQVFDVENPELIQHLQDKWARPFQLRFSEKNMLDARPVSLMSFATVKDLGVHAGMEMDHRRFRMNFYVDWSDASPRFEDTLVGSELRIGETFVMRIWKGTGRCVMTNVDQTTAEKDPRVLKAIGKVNKGLLGVDGPVIRQGIVKVGDAIYLNNPK